MPFRIFLRFHWLFEKSKYPEFIVSNRISGLFDEEYILGGFILSLFPISLFFCKKYFQNKNIFINFLSFSVLIYLFNYNIRRESYIGKIMFIFHNNFITYRSFWKLEK